MTDPSTRRTAFPSIKPYLDVPTLQSELVDSFCELAHESVRTQGRFRVSLSGGSTPKVLYQRLAERDLPWDKIDWFWGDERNVPHDHEDSNYRMVRHALLQHIPSIESKNIHAVPVDVESPAAAAAHYDQHLKSQFHSEWPQWDLVLLGMGDDAHTASLFPNTDALYESNKWFVENWVPKFDAFRYTLTVPAINSGKEIWFIITGSAKQSAMSNVLSDSRDHQKYPSQMIRPSRWFVSADAMPG